MDKYLVFLISDLYPSCSPLVGNGGDVVCKIMECLTLSDGNFSPLITAFLGARANYSCPVLPLPGLGWAGWAGQTIIRIHNDSDTTDAHITDYEADKALWFSFL